MRDDLLDAEASVNWARSQIPVMQTRFIAWQQGYPYEIVQERDPESGQEFAVAVQKTPLPLEFSAEAGAIINALRGSLDILASSLARRNGKKPHRLRHFPIFNSAQEMIDPLTGIDGAECKKWLSDAERATIKSLKPYQGGDYAIWPLHELDIIRKHERLLVAAAPVRSVLLLGNARMRIVGENAFTRLDHKTFLYPLNPGEILRSTKGNTLFVIDIMLNESGLGISDEPVIPALMRFESRIREIINLFDVP